MATKLKPQAVDTEFLAGWINPQETWTYASATTFTISGDLTGKYQKGDKIKFTQATDGVKYMYIIGVSESGGTTTITVTGGSDYDLDIEAITANYYSKVENPQSFPAYFEWTSNPGSQAGTWTKTVKISHFTIKGQRLFFANTAFGSLTGSNATYLTFQLPVTPLGDPADYAGGCRVQDTSGYAGFWQHQGSGVIRCYKYDTSAIVTSTGCAYFVQGFVDF